ncbi:hypothetical protein CGMCC3_g17613 [Colletotrichum fructicola]|nr:uncharacterized protein CGMCC3_g17613 [Colletotrichum fructicola]KAE9566221.1 hypothetical protein CGMCC3_g17613 [Colletotrichum fructicola]
MDLMFPWLKWCTFQFISIFACVWVSVSVSVSMATLSPSGIGGELKLGASRA